MSVTEHMDFLRIEIETCSRLRIDAQSLYDPSAREIIYESILLRAFRTYENFIERVFISYLVGEPCENGVRVESFASPRDDKHARKILASSASSRFLDWSEPSGVLDRCRVFLEDDSPVFTAVNGKFQHLKWMKNLRNHVAHNSFESSFQYSGVIQDILLTVPMSVPSPGLFLQDIPSKGPLAKREILAFFLSMVLECGEAAAGMSKK